MTKTGLIILADGFEDIEAVTAIDILHRGGIDLTIAGLTSNVVRGVHTVTIQTPTTLPKVSKEFDVLVLPGGTNGAIALHQSALVNQWINRMNTNNKLIAAICAAPAIVLAPTGILNHKKATCYPDMEDSFDKSTTFLNQPVVVDGNIITSRGPATTIPFALAIVEKLISKELADKIATAILTR